MKNLAISIFSFITLNYFRQNFNYPVLPKSGSKLENFIPKNWSILNTANGDLNNDLLTDFAIVLQYNDSVKLVDIDSSEVAVYYDTVLTQPRMLAIALYNKATKQFELAEQSNSFILNHDNPNMEEPFQDISIKNNVLTISFSIFMNSGGWTTSNNIYRFRYQENNFKLIGADYNSTHRGSGEIENRSYNFLTKKELIETGSISDDKLKKQWKVFSFKKLKTFKTFLKPFTYEIEKDNYI